MGRGKPNTHPVSETGDSILAPSALNPPTSKSWIGPWSSWPSFVNADYSCFICTAHGNLLGCPNLRFVPLDSKDWYKCQTGTRVVSCLAYARRCDGHIDCLDSSDEQGCGT